MSSYLEILENIFLAVGRKTVSHTDVFKDAYVVDNSQKKVFDALGVEPGIAPNVTLISLHVLGTDKVLTASYYQSIREGAGRVPEIRMGRFLFWLKEGDDLFIATDGTKIFVGKLKPKDKLDSEQQSDYEEKATKALGQIDPKLLLKKAKAAKPKPIQHTTETTVFERNLYVKAYVVERSKYNCEMPGCTYKGFEKPDGSLFIEVHHILPLSEDGADIVENSAALCPNCHAKAHHSKDKSSIMDMLHDKIMSKPYC